MSLLGVAFISCFIFYIIPNLSEHHEQKIYTYMCVSGIVLYVVIYIIYCKKIRYFATINYPLFIINIHIGLWAYLVSNTNNFDAMSWMLFMYFPIFIIIIIVSLVWANRVDMAYEKRKKLRQKELGE